MDKYTNKTFFAEQLLRWFKENKRDLPWRKDKNPYHIWVSEIMLQQTQVKTVIPYFERFIDSFPTVDDLAAASEEEVLKHWEGLGYYSRARNLHEAVREVQEVYGSVVPDNPEQIAKLKGIGPYTKGAILSIAFNQPEPAVDGNVMRVLSRYYLIRDDITKHQTRRAMEQLVREIIPHGQAGDFNEALMELGALVCTPRNPQCETCPVKAKCAARLSGEQLALPVKKRGKPPRIEQRLVALVEGQGEQTGRFLVRQRAETGLLARMWELPHVLIDEQLLEKLKDHEKCAEFLTAALRDEEDIAIVHPQHFMDIEHIFTHIHWKMSVYICKQDDLTQFDDEQTHTHYRWMTLDELSQYPFPQVFLRIIEQYEQSAWIYM